MTKTANRLLHPPPGPNRRGLARVARWALVVTLLPLGLAVSAPTTLKVAAVDTLPGFHLADRTFGVRRPITIEARLYLNGAYQALVEKQAVIQGGPDDADLAATVASVTQNLLGPQGAYRAVESGQRPASPAR